MLSKIILDQHVIKLVDNKYNGYRNHINLILSIIALKNGG